MAGAWTLLVSGDDMRVIAELAALIPPKGSGVSMSHAPEGSLAGDHCRRHGKTKVTVHGRFMPKWNYPTEPR